jgi:hypothetical protein
MPDSTTINTTEKFTKTWRFKNIGTCTWTTAYKFIFIGGDKMDAPNSITLPSNVAPSETIDISINLIAPATPGIYKGIWSFEDNTGKQFGLGSSSKGQIWVQVEVELAPTNSPTQPTQTSEPTIANPFSTPPLETLAYDFVSEICSAQWFSNNILQPCPESGSEAQNPISLVTLPTLEDGTTLNNPAIMISPINTNGSIQGIYPEYLVQPGDHFRAMASCEANSIPCSAIFRFSYQDGSNAVVVLWVIGEFYDQKYTQIDIDISALAGQMVKFILDVTPLNSDPGNHVFWASPGIFRETLPTATTTSAPTATQTATNTPSPTATLLPSPTPAPTPQTETEPQSILEEIKKFFADIFKFIFGD